MQTDRTLVRPRQKHTRSSVTAALGSVLLLLYASTTVFLVVNSLVTLCTLYIAVVDYRPTYPLIVPDPVYLRAVSILEGNGTCVMTGALTVNVCAKHLSPICQLSYYCPQDIVG